MPSLADAGYLTALPLLVAGVLAFPTAPMRATARLRTLLDGLLIAASLLFLGGHRARRRLTSNDTALRLDP